MAEEAGGSYRRSLGPPPALCSRATPAASCSEDEKMTSRASGHTGQSFIEGAVVVALGLALAAAAAGLFPRCAGPWSLVTR
jgi:hypothetical protein